MRIAAAAALLLAACAASNAPVKEPEIGIMQLSTVAQAARDVVGPLTLHYAVTVHNVAEQPITLKRIDMNSIGLGAYALGPTSRPFNVTIAPGDTQSVEVWTAGNVTDQTILGANGPVTIHAVLAFDSAAGSFQSVVTEQVHAIHAW